MKFPSILKKLREEHELSQDKLGKILELSQQAIYKWERGIAEPDNETLVKLANIFNVTTDFLLGRTKYPNELLPDNYSDFLTREELAFAKKEGIVFVVMPEKVAQDLTPEKVRSFIKDIKNLKE